jgi:hypothetical protein
MKAQKVQQDLRDRKAIKVIKETQVIQALWAHRA